MQDANPTNPTFEGAMERLRQIVEQMESDKLPLEEMLERYEEGTRLVQFCSERLATAEKRIEIIARNASGKVKLAAFENTPTPEAPQDSELPGPKKAPKTPSASKPAPPPDDISLF